MHEAFARAVMMMVSSQASETREMQPEQNEEEEHEDKAVSEHGSLSAETLEFGAVSPEQECAEQVADKVQKEKADDCA